MQRSNWAVNGRTLWLFIKYQIVTKILVGIFILPGFKWLTAALVHLSGRTNLTSGDYTGFIFSLYGIPVALFGVIILILVLAIDINTFIIISALAQEHRFKIKMKEVLLAALKSSKLFFSPLGILLVIYAALILPLLRVGISLSPLKNFKIPNFITSVIFDSPLYSTLYVLLFLTLFIVSLIHIFSVHFILLENLSPRQGLRKSRQLMKKYWKRFVRDYFTKLFQVVFHFAIFAAIFMAFVFIIDLAFGQMIKNENIGAIVMMLFVLEIIGFFTFLLIPVAIRILTKLFYQYNQAEGRTVKINLTNSVKETGSEKPRNKITFKTKLQVAGLLFLVLAGNFILAGLMEADFNKLFKTKVSVELIAHRGGGDLGAENTIESIEAAAEKGARWTEIDVQRTKDGEYIINHDPTFDRTARVNKKPMGMTLAEIKKLKVENEFQEGAPTQPVATLEQVLDTAKGKIGVFVELKGKSADRKMVDEVIQMISAKKMLNECVILSLDYDIIEYTHDQYPQIKTGFLYFFSTGNVKNLKGDYLIMEEREATNAKVNEIHAAGKKAIVWTVNTRESAKKFVLSDVDGIITDHIELLQETIKQANEREHLEIILDAFVRK